MKKGLWLFLLLIGCILFVARYHHEIWLFSQFGFGGLPPREYIYSPVELTATADIEVIEARTARALSPTITAESERRRQYGDNVRRSLDETAELGGWTCLLLGVPSFFLALLLAPLFSGKRSR